MKGRSNNMTIAVVSQGVEERTVDIFYDVDEAIVNGESIRCSSNIVVLVVNG